MERHLQFPPGTLSLTAPSLPLTYPRHFLPSRGGVCATPRDLREEQAQGRGGTRGGQEDPQRLQPPRPLTAARPRWAEPEPEPAAAPSACGAGGRPGQARRARSRQRAPGGQSPFPRPPGDTASPGPRPAAQRWVPPSARHCYESGCAPPPSPPLPPLCPAAGMPKLSKEAKQRLQQLFKGGQFAIRWGFIPVVLYLGFKRGADPGMPEPTIWSLLWG
ncbi:mitochondrial import receptor subunit TOM7 homolog [Cinclus cinclus]|uniref:mitochondrial import receptor subunit TOM7 homolog n=1 Tax=Cinclus cinclus TaxID=127875 RepID=UPI002E16024F